MTWCCKINSKSNSHRNATAASTPCPYTFKYLNYKENYTANNNKCLFWYYHFDKQLYANKAAEIHFRWVKYSTITGSSGDS